MSDVESDAEDYVDLWGELQGVDASEENVYIKLGLVFEGQGVEIHPSPHEDLDFFNIVEFEPLERVVRLMKAGDQHVLLGSDYRADYLYSLAAESVLDPHLQLELGCLLLQRANVDESPLCEHLYTSEDSVDWNPHTEIHEELGPGPPSETERTETIQLALRAYGNAWSYYKWGSNMNSYYVARSLIALDGLRVCYSELEDHKSVWKLCSGLAPWLEGQRGDVDPFVADVRERFADARGRLKPIMIGRASAVKALLRERPWLDKLPVAARGYLADAEYMRLTLRDPSYNPKGVVAAYCMAVEAMLQRRIGDVIDSYLNAAPSEEGERFKDEFLRDRKGDKILKQWTCGTLIIGRWAKNLRNPLFKSVLSKAGADAAFYFEELPRELWKLLDHRNPASHGYEGLFTDEGVLQLRTTVLELIGKLAQVRTILTWTQSNDG